MFLESTVEQRISQWREFRENLSQSDSPLQDVVDLWRTAPRIDRHLDPWQSQRWPTPWELLEENRFCPVSMPLMMGYTLKLSTHFSDKDILIKTFIDHSSQRYYTCIIIDDKVLNYTDRVCSVDELPSSLICQYSKAL